jgi:hypothetical protein
MTSAIRILTVLATSGLAFSMAAYQQHEYFLKFPEGDAKALGQIDRVAVKVSCSWISTLKNLPELYDIEMGYDMPTENVLEARPRLGAAAVDLSRWSGVIGIRAPADADSLSCFSVTVTALGREGVQRQWKGPQLGLPK